MLINHFFKQIPPEPMRGSSLWAQASGSSSLHGKWYNDDMDMLWVQLQGTDPVIEKMNNKLQQKASIDRRQLCRLLHYMSGILNKKGTTPESIAVPSLFSVTERCQILIGEANICEVLRRWKNRICPSSNNIPEQRYTVFVNSMLKVLAPYLPMSISQAIALSDLYRERNCSSEKQWRVEFGVPKSISASGFYFCLVETCLLWTSQGRDISNGTNKVIAMLNSIENRVFQKIVMLEHSYIKTSNQSEEPLILPGMPIQWNLSRITEDNPFKEERVDGSGTQSPEGSCTQVSLEGLPLPAILSNSFIINSAAYRCRVVACRKYARKSRPRLGSNIPPSRLQNMSMCPPQPSGHGKYPPNAMPPAPPPRQGLITSPQCRPVRLKGWEGTPVFTCSSVPSIY